MPYLFTGIAGGEEDRVTERRWDPKSHPTHSARADNANTAYHTATRFLGARIVCYMHASHVFMADDDSKT